jgi:hypothetical protein
MDIYELDHVAREANAVPVGIIGCGPSRRSHLRGMSAGERADCEGHDCELLDKGDDSEERLSSVG